MKFSESNQVLIIDELEQEIEKCKFLILNSESTSQERRELVHELINLRLELEVSIREHIETHSKSKWILYIFRKLEKSLKFNLLAFR